VSWHDVLTLALLVVVAAPVGALPGTTQEAWQLAAWALHVIMQLVTVEVCASRILPANAPPAWALPRPKTSAAIAKRRMQ
jgi:hypothetical protein